MQLANAEQITADLSDMESFPECDKLAGRLRDICMGVSGLPRDIENKYRAMPEFGSLPPLPDNVPTARPDHKNSSRGLGDTIAKITKATGIAAVVDYVAEKITGKKDGCGCKKRQQKLNELVPYGDAP